jgi:DNA topoisomerase-1
MSKNLLIVESPAKAKTIQGYLGKDYEVASCNGHIRDLPKNNRAIDIENGFQPTYEINKDKKQLVKELRNRASKAKQVYLASDDDREGEAISWHLKETLSLDESKTKRIVFREITKNAIINAIHSPRNIDLDLVNSQQARRVLDRLVGFDLSPLLWKKIKPGLSAGRVQSVAVRMIVERERSINRFQQIGYFVVNALFNLGKGRYLKAELEERFQTLDQAYAFLEQCIHAEFSIQDLEKKPSKRSPAAPFITSTLQQEASYKLGYAVSRTMILAQNLYEAGKISYMRTDSSNLSQEAVESAQQEIIQSYGAEYFKARKYKSRSAAQEAHEAIRPTDFSQRVASDNSSEQRLYELIWRRAIASQMADAQLEKTTATIAISSSDKKLLAQGEVIKFDGFLKVYSISQEEDESSEQSTMLPPLSIGQSLQLDNMQAKERFSKPPARYTEASLVKQLEEQGIGRPSTYAPIISTIQQRGYVVKESKEGQPRSYQLLTLQNKAIKQETGTEIVGTEKNKLFPTDVAMVVNDFLVNRFTEITDYGFTAKVEEKLDKIATGDQEWRNMLAEFYKNFYPKVAETAQLERTSINSTRLLGTDPATSKPVIARLGRYGPLVQLGEATEDTDEQPRFASLHPGQRLESITLEEALKLFQLPKEISSWQGDAIIANVGRFGPYLKYRDKFYALPKGEEPLSITEARAIEIIQAKQEQDAKKLIKSFDEDPDIQILNGQYGPYIKAGKRNIRLPKDVDPIQLTLADCKNLIEQAPERKKRFTRKK